MAEKPKYQNAYSIFKERYSKKLKKDKKLTQKDIDDLVLQKWKFLPDDQRQPYIKRFEESKKILQDSSDNDNKQKKVKTL